MSEYTERLLTSPSGKDKSDRLRLVWLIVIPLIAILFQVYVPRFVSFLSAGSANVAARGFWLKPARLDPSPTPV